ncbi:hypothetical protein BJY52DRAFT_1420699 [Lactarius psammicola]|nr:hypothetical protein BJY52DRAFT_1420699 [Lactarius psammicola]
MASLRAILNETTPPSSPQLPHVPADDPDTVDGEEAPIHDPAGRADTPFDNSEHWQGRAASTDTYTPPLFSSLDPFCMTPTCAQKRPSQAIQSRAEAVCKRMCLAPPSASKVHEFIQAKSTREQTRLNAEEYKLLKLSICSTSSSSLVPLPRVRDHISVEEQNVMIYELLNKKIEEYVFRVLLRDDLPFYVKKKEDVATVVQKILVEHPDWGLTPKVHDNKVQFDIVMCRISERTNDRRSEFKRAISQSMYEAPTKAEPRACIPLAKPQTIYELCKTLTKISPHINVKVSLGMLGRVAILRHVYKESPGRNFWNKVDDNLTAIRDQCNNDRRAISAAIQKILKHDCRIYGPFDLTTYLATGSI